MFFTYIDYSLPDEEYVSPEGERLKRKHSCRMFYGWSFLHLPHFSSQAFAIAMPADEAVRRIMTAIALLVFTARYCILIRQPSVRQILERLFDFVVFQFDTPPERKKAGTFDFSKVPALPTCLLFLICKVYIIQKPPPKIKKRRIVDSTKPTIRRLNFCDIYFWGISKSLSEIRGNEGIKWLKTRFG